MCSVQGFIGNKTEWSHQKAGFCCSVVCSVVSTGHFLSFFWLFLSDWACTTNLSLTFPRTLTCLLMLFDIAYFSLLLPSSICHGDIPHLTAETVPKEAVTCSSAVTTWARALSTRQFYRKKSTHTAQFDDRQCFTLSPVCSLFKDNIYARIKGGGP